MLGPIALLLQAVADPSPPALPERIDLMQALDDARCARAADEDEIVVCARRSLKEAYRLERLPDTYEEQPMRAETTIAGSVKAGVEAEGATVGGFTSNRVMVRFKLPF